MMAEDQSSDNIVGRLERLPRSWFHTKFALLLASGEWAESLMLFGSGAILGLVATYYGLGKNVLTVYAIPAFFFAGEFVGSIVLGRIADNIGRKTVFAYNQLIFGLGMIIAGFMNGWFLISLFVFIGGIGVGGEYPLVDSYNTEIFGRNVRGKWLALIYVVAITAAPLIVYIASLTAHMGYYSFRIPLWFMGIAGIIVWVLRLRLRESPRWLATHGKMDKAKQIMSEIESDITKSTGKELPKVTSAPAVQEKKAKFSEIFAPDVRRTTIIMTIFNFLQSGIAYGFVTFAPGLVVVSYPKSDPLGAAAVIFGGFIAGGLFNTLIVDRVERKLGITVSLAMAGVFGTMFVVIHGLTEVVIFGFLTAFCIWNFSIFYHQYNSEVFPTRLRTTASGFVYSWSRISTTIFILFIAYVIGAHNGIGIFTMAWILIAIIALILIPFGPKSTRKVVEEISA